MVLRSQESPKALTTAGWALWIIGALIPLIGATLGYSISFLVGRIPALKKAGTFGHQQYCIVLQGKQLKMKTMIQ